MTKKELSKLQGLNRKAERLNLEYEKLLTSATSCTSQITGMPHASGVSDKVGNFAREMADLKTEMEANLRKCFAEIRRINEFIETIEDPMMQTIIAYRYINNLSWLEIAFNIGEHDEQVPRKRIDRFLEGDK